MSQAHFIITSAINTKHGMFNAEARLAQTQASIVSVRSRVEDATIVILDSSVESPLTSQQEEALKESGANTICTYGNYGLIQNIYRETDNHDIVKNYTELVTLIQYLYNNRPLPSRVFKLSGRYTLNDNFNLDAFLLDDLKDNYIFAKHRQSQFDPRLTGGLTLQFPSRLWSFPAHKIDLVLSRLHVMLEDFDGCRAKGYYRDMEHLLFRYFSGPFLTEFEKIGVSGQIAPNGLAVSD